MKLGYCLKYFKMTILKQKNQKCFQLGKWTLDYRYKASQVLHQRFAFLLFRGLGKPVFFKKHIMRYKCLKWRKTATAL